MLVVIIIAAVYSILQIIYYIRKRYIKEIFVFLVLIFISVFYMIGSIKDFKAPVPTDIIEFIFRPVSELFFEIKS